MENIKEGLKNLKSKFDIITKYNFEDCKNQFIFELNILLENNNKKIVNKIDIDNLLKLYLEDELSINEMNYFINDAITIKDE